MAKKSDGTNGQKIGRNSRSNSSKAQKGRTERNKAKRIKANPYSVQPVNFPHRPLPRPVERHILTGTVPHQNDGLPLHLYYTKGVLVEISPRRLDGIGDEHRILNPISGGLTLVR